MIRFEKQIILGLVSKALAVAIPVSVGAGLMWGWRVGAGVVFGEALMLANIVFIAWLLGRGLGRGGGKRAPMLAALFLVKLLVLFGLSYYVLAVIGLDPIGFVAGCMLSLVVLSWQVVSHGGGGGVSDEEEGAD